jgi:hypothetical protein
LPQPSAQVVDRGVREADFGTEFFDAAHGG